MKITFLSGGLEPGQDGVGDYTRSLAQECTRQGHDCCIVALNDRCVLEPTTTNINGLKCLRLSPSMSWPQRIRAAQEMLATFASDWVSLQFVPYAFHPKGFVHGLGRRLRPLLAGRQVQVMFHELWLGEAQDASPKHRLIGTLQKAFVWQMLKHIEPQVVHTSNDAYVGVLAQQGVSAARLPLFGNIRVTEKKADAWLFAEISKVGAEINESNRNDFLLIGFFGALHPIWPPEPLISYLCQAATETGRRLVLLSAGQLRGGEILWAQMAAHYVPTVTFVYLGPQSGERVSQYFNSLDYGIATSPWSLIGKSGSVAAMLEHGLPVIVNRDDAKFPCHSADSPAEPLLYKMSDRLAMKIMKGLPRSQRASRLPETARSFLDSLTNIAQVKDSAFWGNI